MAALAQPLCLPGPAPRQWTALFDGIQLQDSWPAPAPAAAATLASDSSAAAVAAACSWADLPADLSLAILVKLDPRTLGLCARLSRSFAALVRHPRLWERMCSATWRQRFDGRDRAVPALRKLMLNRYGSWRGLFIEAPRVRTDGVYVSQNFRTAHARYSTGIRGLKPSKGGGSDGGSSKGQTSKERGESYESYSRCASRNESVYFTPIFYPQGAYLSSNVCLFVVYLSALNARIPFYRYLRFCADGRVMSLDVVDTPQEVVNNLKSVSRADLKYNNLGVGRYEQLPDAVYVRCPHHLKSHPNMKKSEKRSRMVYDTQSSNLNLKGYHAVVGEEVSSVLKMMNCALKMRETICIKRDDFGRPGL